MELNYIKFWSLVLSGLLFYILTVFSALLICFFGSRLIREEASQGIRRIIMIPIFVCILSLILKACWKCCWSRGSSNDEEHLDTPIYVIPIPINTIEDYGSDEDSVASVDPYAPPSYDSLDPPPLYSEQKLSIPDEAPPAYSQLEIPPGSAEHSGVSSPSEPQQTFHYEE